MTRNGEANALALAIKRGEWERVGLCLLLGLSLAARETPPETIDRLLELLAGDDAAACGDKRARHARR